MFKKLQLFIFLSFIIFSSFSQSLLSEYETSDVLNEKLMLFTNKELYLAGEKLCFTVQTYEGVYNENIDLSKIVYVELISQDGTIINKAKVFLENRLGEGSFLLTSKVETDYYFIRAYTQYMRNFGSSHFVHKRISVVNTFKYLSEQSFATDTTYKIAVRNAGENLASDFVNEVFVMLKNVKKEAFVNCNIVDNNDIVLVSESRNSELIKMQVTPLLGVQYKVKLILKDTVIYRELPEVKNVERIVLKENLDTLIIQKRGLDELNYFIEIYKGSVLLSSKKISNQKLVIRKSELPNGIITFSLFDSNKKLIQNLNYYNSYSPISVVTNELKEIFAVRKNVSIKNSLNIANASYHNFVVPRNISEQFKFYNPLLINDLCAISDTIDYELFLKASTDSLWMQYVLSQSRQQKFTGSNKIFIPEIEGDIVSGNASKKNKSEAENNRFSFLVTIPDSLNYFLDVVSADTLGDFNLIIAKEYHTPNLVFSIFDTLQEYTFQLYEEFENAVLPIRREMFKPSKDLADYLKQQLLILQVNDAFETTKEKAMNSNNTSFYGAPTLSIDFEKYIKLPILEEYIKELMSGTYVIKKKKRKYIRISDIDAQGYTGTEPLILVNGIHALNHEVVLNINPKNIAYVRVLNNKVFFKNIQFHGIIEIVTYDFIPANKLKKNLFVESFIQSQFKNSDVKTQFELPNQPIFMNSLYSSVDSKSEFTFFTADMKGFFDMVSIAISKDLQFIIEKKTLEIK
ncbi:MAG: hypothetical protein IPO21_20135 [Bacteroidales bacterium]|nr:hypothetical protein [Bacteroidales bacterium]